MIHIIQSFQCYLKFIESTQYIHVAHIYNYYYHFFKQIFCDFTLPVILFDDFSALHVSILNHPVTFVAIQKCKSDIND